MKTTLRLAIHAVGLACLLCLGFIGPLMAPSHRWIFHNVGDAATIYVAVFANVAIIAAVLFAFLRIAVRHPRWNAAIETGLLFSLPWLVLQQVALLYEVRVPHAISIPLLLLSFLGWFYALRFARPSQVFSGKRLQAPAQALLLGLGLGGCVLLMQLVWCGWQVRGLEPAAHTVSTAAPSGRPLSSRPRIVWILFDELSYRQVYEHRYAGLQLPAFDQLAAQSTLFTDVQPAAVYTEAAVPSMLTGLRVDQVGASSDGLRLALHDPVTGRWQRFDQHDTVFQDAQNLGFTTAIAGWFNPYCRILPAVLDRCFWAESHHYLLGMDADASLARNIAAPWVRVVHHLSNGRFGTASVVDLQATAHRDDYVTLATAADTLLEDPSIDFLFLHIPVPHPGGIYDRRTRTLSLANTSYIDNLALADRYLGHVHALLQQRGEWDPATVMVMGDHSWRTSLIWTQSELWTTEDQAASGGGQFDPRPAYIVKLPFQSRPARIDGPFPARDTRALLQALLRRSVDTPEALASVTSTLAPDRR